MEELCFCMRENAFLLDMSLMNEQLAEWIDRECKLTELARELYPIIRKSGTLSSFVTLIMEYVGLYDAEVIQEVERTLREGSGLSSLEKRKNQVDYMVKKGKFLSAAGQYDELLSNWEKADTGEERLPGACVKAAILHNKGVALAALLDYDGAASCFLQANAVEADERHYQSYLAAKRMSMAEGDYLSFLATKAESYEPSLALEKRIEQLQGEYEQSEEHHRLEQLQEWHSGNERQKYYEELENIAQSLKDKYRESISG
jgi:hypothetical protein